METLLDQRKMDGVVVVNLSGKITFGETANRMLETVSDLLERGEQKIVFNFEKVQYIDSAGLGVLVKCRNKARASQGVLKLATLPKGIRDLMRITKLISLFEISDSEAESVASFQ